MRKDDGESVTWTPSILSFVRYYPSISITLRLESLFIFRAVSISSTLWPSNSVAWPDWLNLPGLLNLFPFQSVLRIRQTSIPLSTIRIGIPSPRPMPRAAPREIVEGAAAVPLLLLLLLVIVVPAAFVLRVPVLGKLVVEVLDDGRVALWG